MGPTAHLDGLEKGKLFPSAFLIISTANYQSLYQHCQQPALPTTSTPNNPHC